MTIRTLLLCGECNRMFPSHLMMPFKRTEAIDLPPMCPLCALDLKNRLLRLPKGMPFINPIKRKLYLEALEYAEGRYNIEERPLQDTAKYDEEHQREIEETPENE